MDDDQTVDTSLPPDEGQDAGADTGTDAGYQDQAQEPEPEPEPTPQPRQLTPEEIEERAFQRTASWMGRRERELSDNILRNVSQLLDTKLSQIHTPAEPPVPSDPSAILENPDRWAEAKIRAAVPEILRQEIQRTTQAEQQYATSVIKETASLMDSDPLFADKQLGTEVIAEIQKMFPQMDKRVPANVAAELLINKSLATVTRRQRLAKQNPLANNTPGRAPATQTPPVAAKAKEPAIKLDPIAQKVAKWFGNSEDEIRSMLK